MTSKSSYPSFSDEDYALLAAVDKSCQGECWHKADSPRDLCDDHARPFYVKQQRAEREARP